MCGATPSRDMTEEAIEDNLRYDSWVKKFTEEMPDFRFVDIMSCEMLNRKDIFVDDGVHYNSEGYRLFGEFFKEVLKDELAEF